MLSAETLIEFEQVSVQAGSGHILRDISFTLPKGKHSIILGPNGAGKTTLLKVAAGLIPSSEGGVRILGKDLSILRRKRLAELISLVQQQLGFVFPHTVYDFVMMSRYARQGFLVSSAEDRKVVEEVLEITDVLSFRDRAMDTLSGGECQRVLIASALASEPQGLILDEPSTYLDPKHHAIMKRLLADLVETKGITILSVTHDVNFAVSVGQKWLGLKDGYVVFDTETRPRAEQLAQLYGIEFVEFVASDRSISATLPGEVVNVKNSVRGEGT